MIHTAIAVEPPVKELSMLKDRHLPCANRLSGLVRCAGLINPYSTMIDKANPPQWWIDLPADALEMVQDVTRLFNAVVGEQQIQSFCRDVISSLIAIFSCAHPKGIDRMLRTHIFDLYPVARELVCSAFASIAISDLNTQSMNDPETIKWWTSIFLRLSAEGDRIGEIVITEDGMYAPRACPTTLEGCHSILSGIYAVLLGKDFRHVPFQMLETSEYYTERLGVLLGFGIARIADVEVIEAVRNFLTVVDQCRFIDSPGTTNRRPLKEAAYWALSRGELMGDDVADYDVAD